MEKVLEEVRKLTAEQSRLYKPMIFRKANLKGFAGAKKSEESCSNSFKK